MVDRRADYLAAMGIDVWVPKIPSGSSLPEGGVNRQIPPTPPLSKGGMNCESSQSDLQSLREKVANCTACELHKTRTQTVFGVGNPNADLLIVGEAPGANEDKQGEPFVGRAGKLLNDMLRAIDLQRDDIFIANVLKCRPPSNRDPKPEEVATCTPFLQSQINALKPKLIVAVGRVAAHFLLKNDIGLGRMRGQVYHYGEAKTPLIVTYHPAYLLRSPDMKSRAYSDLLLVKRLLQKS